MNSSSKKKASVKKASKKKVSTKKASKKVVEKNVEKKKASKKEVTKKKSTTVKKKGEKKAASKSKKLSGLEITAEERWRMIAVAAYHKAEQRNFMPGNELEDWVEAEKEIDKLINV